MKKIELLREIRDVLCGRHGHTWLAVAREGQGWKIAGSGIGKIYRASFEPGTLFFHHDRNTCILFEAGRELEAEITRRIEAGR